MRQNLRRQDFYILDSAASIEELHIEEYLAYKVYERYFLNQLLNSVGIILKKLVDGTNRYNSIFKKKG